MSTPIGEILKKYNVRPLKRLGQNFLIDGRILSKIVKAAELKPNDVVLEIGPGLGNLTSELAKRVKKVIAVEKDRRMMEALKETLKEFKNTEVIHGDILKIFDLPSPKIVANIPYYLTSPLIRKFLEAKSPPEFMVLLVQKEVAQRICAKPPNMNLLAVSVQFYAVPKIISYVSKNCFFPQPKVDSAIIKIAPKISRVRPCSIWRERLFLIVRAGFSQPRKQLLNNLANGLKLDKQEISRWLLENNIQPSQRAETLSVEDWIKLVESGKIKK